MRARMAFITDIRRGNLHTQLMYKALFEMSEDRVAFVQRLFSRARPEGLTAETPVSAEFVFRGTMCASSRSRSRLPTPDRGASPAAKWHPGADRAAGPKPTRFPDRPQDRPTRHACTIEHMSPLPG